MAYTQISSKYCYKSGPYKTYDTYPELNAVPWVGTAVLLRLADNVE